MLDHSPDDLHREIEDARDRVAVGTAQLDQLERKVHDLEATFTEQAVDYERRRAWFVLGASGLVTAGLALVTVGRVLPSLVLLATMVTLGAVSSARAATSGMLLFAALVGAEAAFLNMSVGTAFLAATAVAVMSYIWLRRHARVAARQLYVAVPFPFAATALRALRASRVEVTTGPLWLSALIFAGYSAWQLQDHVLVAVMLVLALAYLSGLVRRSVPGRPVIIMLMLLCSTSTLVYGAVRTNTIAPYRASDLPKPLASRLSPSPPTYTQTCSSMIPGTGAPRAQARMIAAQWNSYGAAIAGCPLQAQSVASHPQLWFAAGQCDGIVRSVAVATSMRAALLLGEPARFTLAKGLDGSLRSASSRFRVGTGDAYVVRTTSGSWVFIRRSLAAAAADTDETSARCAANAGQPYVRLSPSLSAAWMGLMNEHGWLWPVQSGPDTVSFIQDRSNRIVAKASCTDSWHCHVPGRGMSPTSRTSEAAILRQAPSS
jgi:hypothetical protein